MNHDEALQALGLESNATGDQIKKKYRLLCLKLHPDHANSPAEKEKATKIFLKIRDAYEFFKKNGIQSAKGLDMADQELEALLRRLREQEERRTESRWYNAPLSTWQPLRYFGVIILVRLGFLLLPAAPLLERIAVYALVATLLCAPLASYFLLRSRYLRPILALCLMAMGIWAWTRWRDRDIPVPGLWQGLTVSVPPSPDERALGRPEVGERNRLLLRENTAFILDREGRLYIVSCYDIFENFVDDLIQVSILRDDRRIAHAVRRLKVASRGASIEERDARADLAVFATEPYDAALRPLVLARQAPQVGQPVWIFFLRPEERQNDFDISVNGPRTGDWRGYMLRGIVTRSSNVALEFRYDSPLPNQTTAGAPILDQDGRVVGVNVGTLTDKGSRFGLAAPYASLVDIFQRNKP